MIKKANNPHYAEKIKDDINEYKALTEGLNIRNRFK